MDGNLRGQNGGELVPRAVMRRLGTHAIENFNLGGAATPLGSERHDGGCQYTECQRFVLPHDQEIMAPLPSECHLRWRFDPHG